jgi:hypothetical protein
MRLIIPKKAVVWSAVLVGTLALGMGAKAGEPTAFDLAKEGNRYVGEQCKDKIVQIRSDKSVGSLAPTYWYIVYYDPTATFKASEVKFGAGKMMNVSRPVRMLEPVTKDDVQLNHDKLKVDSDKAIKTALAEPLLKNLKPTSVQLKLERMGSDSAGDPVWKVKIWAAKLREPNKEANVGEIWVAAADGKVVKNELHINSVD